ncbi:hypothetical protein SLEP1_g57702 [Rubroshorea leprosula]|uniref:DUF4219 domain-containing protein n=1 Tax=Rubroshorea leprosula TaxID=152421 RepID=A0AAV5MMB6_9ROSI|nr:hypothetical protein SLEP1_g57702 [Rubroshorea leprosula]
MATCPSMIVPEVLRKENYERWSILMGHYLVAQNLWDVVQVNEMPDQGEWIQKNALALHSIKVSCGTEMFNRIKKMDSAKAAWDALAEMQRPPSYHDLAELREVFPQDIDELQEEIPQDNDELQEETPTVQHTTLHDLICRGNIGKVKQFLRDNPDSRSESILDPAIHVAITAGKKDIARYLYEETLQCLNGDRGFFLLQDRGFFLLQECIKKKMFGMSFKNLFLFAVNVSLLSHKLCTTSNLPHPLILGENNAIQNVQLTFPVCLPWTATNNRHCNSYSSPQGWN